MVFSVLLFLMSSFCQTSLFCGDYKESYVDHNLKTVKEIFSIQDEGKAEKIYLTVLHQIGFC